MKETMGQIIKRLRKANGFTQEELAEQVGVTFQAVSKWENGAGLPDISQVVPLANALKVSTDVLFGRLNTMYRDEVVALVHDAYNLIDGVSSSESLLRCYNALQDGLGLYPNDITLLAHSLEIGISLAYPENDCYDAEHGKDIYQNCVREAELIIKYCDATTTVLRAHMIMVLLHAAYGNTEAAKDHARCFPTRADMTLDMMFSFIAHFEGNYKEEAKRLQHCILYHTEALIDSTVALSACYETLENTADALFVLETVSASLESATCNEDPRPHFHYRERGDIFALLARLYLKVGDSDKALNALTKMVDFDCSVAHAHPIGKRLKSPFLNDVDHNLLWLPGDIGAKLRQKLSDPAFEPLHDHPAFLELSVKAKSI